jgi:hypothetical protein
MISNALQNLACPNGLEQEDWITSNSKLLFEFHQKNRSLKDDVQEYFLCG